MRPKVIKMRCRMKALPTGRAFFICLMVLWWWGGAPPSARAVDAGSSHGSNGEMTDDEARRLGEEFGVVVDSVDEEIRKELKMQRPEGVAVFEVIAGTPADSAGIKVRAVIKEIDKYEVRNLKDFGMAMKRTKNSCNFTVGTYEPADPDTQGVGGAINFHFVGCKQD
jgi:hypothetical protein